MRVFFCALAGALAMASLSHGVCEAKEQSFNLDSFSAAYRGAVEEDGYFDLISPGKRGSKAKQGEAGYVVRLAPWCGKGNTDCVQENSQHPHTHTHTHPRTRHS